MKITFESSFKKRYVEITPTVAIGWWTSEYSMYVGWIFWSVNITIKK